jgi:hypothetical protein
LIEATSNAVLAPAGFDKPLSVEVPTCRAALYPYRAQLVDETTRFEALLT